MKKLAIIFSGLALACNNAAPPAADTTGTAAEGHQHHEEMAPAKDTTAILPGQKVFFANLEDGQEIKLPYIVKFGVEGMEVEPAMGVVPNKGHHHLFVDQPALEANTMVPMGKEGESKGYYHFGKGQVLDTLNIKKYGMLTPGKHKLTLQFANGMHMSYGPAMSKSVTITVK